MAPCPLVSLCLSAPGSNRATVPGPQQPFACIGTDLAQVQWECALATQDAEIRRMEVWSQLRQIVCKTLSWKNPSQKRTGGVARGVGSEFKSQYWKKNWLKCEKVLKVAKSPVMLVCLSTAMSALVVFGLGFVLFVCLFVLTVLGLELRNSCLLHRHSTTWMLSGSWPQIHTGYMSEKIVF
jgi:hypothetical protein